MQNKGLWLAFFLSGIAGLSYELTWLRYLTQLFGASTPAVAATVAIFFVGLALGAALGARLFAGQSRPLFRYGILELSIGAVALLVPLMFSIADRWLIHALPTGGENVFVLLLVAGVMLIVPTVLLGATFPAMAAIVEHRGNVTRDTGLFYGFNTLGAVIGCLLISFWGLPKLGQQHATWCMALLNALVGLFCLRMGMADPPKTKEAKATPNNKETDDVHPANRIPTKLGYGVALISGFCAIGIEVMWSRALSLSVAGSVYVFALILAAYLTGIGLGSLWISLMHKTAPPRRTGLSLLYLAACCGTLLTIHLFPKLFPATIQLLNGGQLSSYEQYLGWIGGFAVLMMLPATVVIGAALPLLIGLVTHGAANATQVSGRLYSLNTLGGVAGSLCATFVMMPHLGLTRSIAALAGIYGLLGIAVIFGYMRESSRRYQLGAFVGVLSCFLVLGQLADINPLKYRKGEKLLFYQDMPSGTIGIYQNRRRTRILRVNNYYGLSRTNPKTVRMQYKLGLLPLLLHPKPERTLLIGFATGTTLAAMAAHPKVKKASCVELHDKIPALAPYFARANRKVWKHPKVTIQQADGRRYLLRHQGKFDVIVGDLYLPRNPGVGALYSVEHFAAAKKRLAKGGRFVAWLPGFQLGPKEIATIVKAFLTVFPNAEAWVPHWSETVPIIGLVGTNGTQQQPSSNVAETLEKSVQRLRGGKTVKQLLQQWWAKLSKATTRPTSQPTKAPSLKLLSNQSLRAWSKGAKANRLRHPIVEYAAPKAIMEAKIARFPLASQVILKVGELRDLQGTPWDKLYLRFKLQHQTATPTSR